MDFRGTVNPNPDNPQDNDARKNRYNIQTIAKVLLILFLWALVLLPLRPNFSGDFSGIYHGSLVFLAVGFFCSILGLLSSGRLRGERFAWFCAIYSSICLILAVLLLPSLDLLREFEVPFWLRKQLYVAAISLTNPFTLFFFLAVLLPVVLHFFLPRF